MTFDGITCRAVVLELREKLLGGLVRKINQVGPSTLTLSIYANRSNYLLYLSADPSKSCLFLTEKKYKNPTTPPDFCMVLRKHLSSAKIEDIHQEGLDRTVRLDFSASGDLGERLSLSLVGEFMGKYSNLILVDEEGQVIDAIRRVSRHMSRVRQVFPGKRYEAFPSDKLDILKEDIHLSDLSKNMPPSAQANKIFIRNLTGFSPLAAREILYLSSLDPDKTLSSIQDDEMARIQKVFNQRVRDIRQGTFSPSLYLQNKSLYHAFPVTYMGPADETSPSMSQIIDHYFTRFGRDDQVGQVKSNLQSLLKGPMEKGEKKLLRQEEDYKKTLDREVLKEEGDLLAGQVHRIKKGDRSIEVTDFYHGDLPRTILLDKSKDPWENVEIRYHKYSKLKRANQLLSRSIPQLKEELDYFRQLATMLDHAETMEDLEEIRQEMVDQGLLKKRKKGKKQKSPQAKPPYHYRSKGGLDIYVGRNNKQNDALTLKLANKEDFFFHAQAIPGAHVILRVPSGDSPSTEDMEAAAWLAATHSAQSEEGKVSVDYTEKKNVYKAKGAKPGMVYYNDFSTILVNTDARPELERIE
ncbi:Rqc2 family fibronectin-binding protein [Kallipyga gabonensis]|uniref:Rqc2 family fibronectin-binding protein n=1 Tax=Kallipyga gabonensis TaxID=1686287 RepID=UPI0006B67044|nr:NFACT RNA binding domain-containing protein [Kallipyga gabonensis]